MKKIAIIGSGLSGLSVANLLKNHAQIILFEKSRGVSGRMSTRQAHSYFFDHGAQYFTVRTEVFRDFIRPLKNQGIVKQWNPRYLKFNDNQIIDCQDWGKGGPHYVGAPGMNAIAKYLATDLTVYLNTKIISLKHQNKWQLIDDQGQEYLNFDWVISTVPSVQAAQLIPKYFKYHSTIKKIEMEPCFSLMLGFKETLNLEFEAAHVENADLSWIAINSNKPERGKPFTLVVHSSPKYAKTNINNNQEKITQHLISETSRIIGQNLNSANHKAIHRWLYANTKKRENNTIFLDYEHQLAACGDWCFGNRIEEAFISGYNLANQIKENVL